MGRTRRKKKRSQKPGVPDGDKKIPKTFVIERGKVGHVLSQLVLDLRQMMEPHTASKLKVRHRNVLKDFVSVAGPLGVTHLLLVSRTTNYVNLKVCHLPRGPTLTFHVKAFSLAKEVRASIKKPAIHPAHFITSPMLVLNNFESEDKASHLMSTVLQNMLPSLNVHTVDLANIKRCLLLNSDPESKVIELRHYAIRVVPRGMSRGLKKLSHKYLPDLGRLGDISEYLLGGCASESDGEELGGEGEVTLPQDLPGRGNIKAEQSAIHLSELGPRLTLDLVKIELGFCGGEVLHHSYVQKTRKEAKRLKIMKESQRKLKEERKKEQEANVARKKKQREENRARSLAGMGVGQVESEEDDDAEWFRKEVGQDPDPDLFGSSKMKVKGQRKRTLGGPFPKAKRMKQTDTPTESVGKKNQGSGGTPTAASRQSKHKTMKGRRTIGGKITSKKTKLKARKTKRK